MSLLAEQGAVTDQRSGLSLLPHTVGYIASCGVINSPTNVDDVRIGTAASWFLEKMNAQDDG